MHQYSKRSAAGGAPAARGRAGFLRSSSFASPAGQPHQRLVSLSSTERGTTTATTSHPPSTSAPAVATAAAPLSIQQQLLQTTDRTEQEVPGVDAELELLLQLLPPAVRSVLEARPDVAQLLEVVMDLGRPPSARFPHGDVDLSEECMTAADLATAVAQVGHFDADNRAGIDSTLHRISAMRNRGGRVVGLTCRVGRSVAGAAELVRDLVLEGRSVLLLGRPGVGKTTALREVCRIAADEARRRVVIVDTSNEIGGDGDVPHPSIGGARRMQVSRPEEQHAVMVEAVENHMPQVVVIDEVSTVAECTAARTIAQRGVQLVATAHGNTLENVIKNPTLADLVGGIQSVTLGDEEARRRGVQKSILERAAPPTFDVCVEMEDRCRWRVHMDVAAAVDTLLGGSDAAGQVRFVDGSGGVTRASYMGTVRRTDSSGVSSTQEWWADEQGERDPILWPAKSGAGGRSPSVSSSSTPSTAGPPIPSFGGGSFAPAARNTAAGTQPAPSSSFTRTGGNGNGSSSSNSSRGSYPGRSMSPSSASAASFPPSASPSSSASAAAAAAASPPWRLRALLIMDDEAAARVRAVLGLLRREAYEAALSTSSSSSSSGGGGNGSSSSGGVGSAIAADGSSSPSARLIEVVSELEMADVVIGTKSKLRNTPKIKNAARKRDIPIYALTATSTSALLRNLCPLLGLDPLAVAEVVRAGAAAAADADGGEGGGLLSASGSLDSDVSDEDEEGAGASERPAGQRRTLDLSAADDYAELLATTVRELRYAPLDRSYAQHILGRFIEEMQAAEATAAAPTSSAAPSSSAAISSPAAVAAAAGSTPAVAPLAASEPPVRAGSLAAVAWACSFAKHRKKFVEASGPELAALALACEGRWPEMTAGELLRAATGFSGLRVCPPSDSWMAGLTAAAGTALAASDTAAGQQQEQAAGPGGAGAAAAVLTADDASRLKLAVAELELMWVQQQQEREGQ